MRGREALAPHQKERDWKGVFCSLACSLKNWDALLRIQLLLTPLKWDPYPPLLRMWSSLFCLPMARLLALPSLAWGVRCNLKTLLYLDLISNMTALPTPTLCSQGNSSRLQEKRERKVPSPSPPNPFLSSCRRKYHICLQMHREWQSPTYCYLKINSECDIPVPGPTSSLRVSDSLHVAIGKCRERLSFKTYWLLFRCLLIFFFP